MRVCDLRASVFETDFFFSSRRRHTIYWRDWSSDVCSSDLDLARAARDQGDLDLARLGVHPADDLLEVEDDVGHVLLDARSEECRVGKECRSRWSSYH